MVAAAVVVTGFICGVPFNVSLPSVSFCTMVHLAPSARTLNAER